MRYLWVLNVNERGKFIEKIIQVGKDHKGSIRFFKNKGNKFVGYVQKSPGSETREQRLKLLQNMIKRLNEGSLVDKTFASYMCTSNQLFENRDKGSNEKVPRALGNTQDMLEYVKESKKDIGLITIDFAGLTVSGKDLLDLLQNDQRIKFVIIENFEAENKVYSFSREEVLTDLTKVQCFGKSRTCLLKDHCQLHT